MKKRIVALLLVLVLSMAMLVPVFAATVEPRACNHNWIYLDSVITNCVYLNDALHRITYYYNLICDRCAMPSTTNPVTEQTSHNMPCATCRRFGQIRGIIAET